MKVDGWSYYVSRSVAESETFPTLVSKVEFSVWKVSYEYNCDLMLGWGRSGCGDDHRSGWE